MGNTNSGDSAPCLVSMRWPEHFINGETSYTGKCSLIMSDLGGKRSEIHCQNNIRHTRVSLDTEKMNECFRFRNSSDNIAL